jgi:hypothetical protein
MNAVHRARSTGAMEHETCWKNFSPLHQNDTGGVCPAAQCAKKIYACTCASLLSNNSMHRSTCNGKEKYFFWNFLWAACFVPPPAENCTHKITEFMNCCKGKCATIIKIFYPQQKTFHTSRLRRIFLDVFTIFKTSPALPGGMFTFLRCVHNL